MGGTNLPAPSSGWGLEITLDVELSHAMAPDANIIVVEASSSSLSSSSAPLLQAASTAGGLLGRRSRVDELGLFPGRTSGDSFLEPQLRLHLPRAGAGFQSGRDVPGRDRRQRILPRAELPGRLPRRRRRRGGITDTDGRRLHERQRQQLGVGETALVRAVAAASATSTPSRAGRRTRSKAMACGNRAGRVGRRQPIYRHRRRSTTPTTTAAGWKSVAQVCLRRSGRV